MSNLFTWPLHSWWATACLITKKHVNALAALFILRFFAKADLVIMHIDRNRLLDTFKRFAEPGIFFPTHFQQHPGGKHHSIVTTRNEKSPSIRLLNKLTYILCFSLIMSPFLWSFHSIQFAGPRACLVQISLATPVVRQTWCLVLCVRVSLATTFRTNSFFFSWPKSEPIPEWSATSEVLVANDSSLANSSIFMKGFGFSNVRSCVRLLM